MIETDCCTWGAAEYEAFAAWLASMTQVPAPVKLTVDPLIEQAPELDEASMEKVTGLPEPPPVALTV